MTTRTKRTPANPHGDDVEFVKLTLVRAAVRGFTRGDLRLFRAALKAMTLRELRLVLGYEYRVVELLRAQLRRTEAS